MRLLKIAAGIGLTFAIAVPLTADGGDVTANGELGLFTLGSGYTYGKGVWGFSLYANEWDWRVPSDETFKDFDPLWSNWDLQHRRLSAGFGVGLTDRLELDVALPYESYEAENRHGAMASVGHLLGRTYVGEIDQEGIGDLRVGLRFGLVNTDSSGLSLNLHATAPTGDDEEGVATGEWGYGIGLGWTGGNWTFNGGYRDLGTADVLSEVPHVGLVEQDVSPRVELGLGYAHPFGERWDWITELTGDVKTESTGEYDRADIASGGRYRFGDDLSWAFNFALRADLSHNDFDSADPIGGLIGLTYSTHTHAGVTAAPKDRGPVAPPPVAPPPAAAPPSPPPPPAASTYTLTVRKAGTGGGTVTSTPPGIDCGSDCRETYAPSTQVKLAGKADACSTLNGFGGDCSSDGAVTMSSDKSCVATFDRRATRQTFDACEKYGAWDCKSGLRETVKFANGTAVLAENAASNGRGVLCDWANQLRACPALRLCVAGSNAATEDACVAGERADTLVEFFRRQSGEDAFGGISGRVQAAPSCSPEDEKGSVGNLMLR